MRPCAPGVFRYYDAASSSSLIQGAWNGSYVVIEQGRVYDLEVDFGTGAITATLDGSLLYSGAETAVNHTRQKIIHQPQYAAP